ncbi:MAG: hypothetical protein AAF570_19340, partial [Bacteroidota bacterium]
RQLWFKFLYFLNDFYEDWLPFAALLLLCFVDPWYFILLGLNVLLFPGFLINLSEDVKTISKNLRGK